MLDQVSSTLVDDRGAARGWGRFVFVLFWIAGALTLVFGIWQLFVDTDQPIGPHLVTVLAGTLYLAAAVGFTHNGRRMRVLALCCTIASLAGPIILGLVELGTGHRADVWSPWANFGQAVWFASIWLPVTGLVWLWWSNPRRIVALAEGLDRRRKPVA